MTIRDTTPFELRHSLKDGNDKVPVLALLVFLAVLPLEWMTVVGGGTGADENNLKPFHVAALLLVTVIFLNWRPRDVVGPIWRRHAAVYGSYLVVLMTALAAAFANPGPYLSPVAVVRQGFYATVSLLIAGLVVRIMGRSTQRLLVLSGAIASAILTFAIVYGLVSQGQNPLDILGQALAQGDPDVITFQLLRTTFRTDAELSEVAANLRHQVFIGLLIAVFTGLACSSIIERRRKVLRGAIAGASVIGFSLVLLSLSRSTTLSMVVPFLIYPLRLIVRNRARPAQAVVLVSAVASGVALLISPVGALLFERFSSTDSYTARLTAVGPEFLPHLLPSALIGTSRAEILISPHNFVLISWLAGGVVAGLAATVMLFWIAWCWLREVHRYVTDRPGWVLPVGQIWVLGLGVIPLVRAFTAGNQPHMVEFTATGIFLGITLANERANAARLRRQETDSMSQVAVPAAASRES